ncbi:MAG: hypothetical protein CL515_04745 [Actinobacteria bacterium]|nr:hypothetical protein [Actinomycetota bacterium]|tara:strand:+ start:1963 stop:2181 length:219 start_codon:yes stop_codon:yes gene_type:complete
MLTFNPKFKFLIYLATTIASTYIGLQLTEALCIESCNLDKLLYIVFSNIVFLSGVILLIKLSEKSINEWEEE